METEESVAALLQKQFVAVPRMNIKSVNEVRAKANIKKGICFEDGQILKTKEKWFERTLVRDDGTEGLQDFHNAGRTKKMIVILGLFR